jgi:hypothetical protein
MVLVRTAWGVWHELPLKSWVCLQDVEAGILVLYPPPRSQVTERFAYNDSVIVKAREHSS